MKVNNNSNIRIKDIAKLAGVSEGTVDRVLHKRGEVSVKSKEAVEKALEELNYSPNILARSLAMKKTQRFVCVMPSYEVGDYWQSIDNGFDLALQEFAKFNVSIERMYFNQFDATTFNTVAQQLLSNLPDAVFIAPIFRNETLSLVSALSKNEIPFSYIDSLIENTEYNTYYGQNSFKSGYVASKLLLSTLPKGSKILVVRTKRLGSVSNQTMARYNGFMSYINDNFLADKYEIVHVELDFKNEQANIETINSIFDKHNNIKAAITFNSKVYKLAKILEDIKRSDIALVGYDLLEQNVDYLNQDVVSYIIAQRPEKQAYYTVRDMCKKLIFEQPIKQTNFVPIDILTKENIDDYIGFEH